MSFDKVEFVEGIYVGAFLGAMSSLITVAFFMWWFG